MKKKFISLLLLMVIPMSGYALTPEQFYESYSETVLKADKIEDLYSYWHKNSIEKFERDMRDASRKGPDTGGPQRKILEMFKNLFKSVKGVKPEITLKGDHAKIIVKSLKTSNNSNGTIIVEMDLVKQGNDWKLLLKP